MQIVFRRAHLCAGQVKRLMRYAMHKAAERLTPAPQCTRTAAYSQRVSHPSRSCALNKLLTHAGFHSN